MAANASASLHSSESKPHALHRSTFTVPILHHRTQRAVFQRALTPVGADGQLGGGHQRAGPDVQPVWWMTVGGTGVMGHDLGAPGKNADPGWAETGDLAYAAGGQPATVWRL